MTLIGSNIQKGRLVSPSDSHTSFDTLMHQVQDLPLWIKQVLYLKLRQDLENSLAKSTMNTFNERDCLQLMIPKLGYKGKEELESPSTQHSPELIHLMKLAEQEYTVINICIQCGWTLEMCATHLLKAIKDGYIDPPDSKVTMGTILYLGNEIRLGEYLVNIGRLSVYQLDQALQTQDYISEALGSRTGIGSVLINLGYITPEDSEGILFLKEESKKACPNLGNLGLFNKRAREEQRSASTVSAHLKDTALPQQAPMREAVYSSHLGENEEDSLRPKPLESTFNPFG